MCGIAGFVDWGDDAVLERMTQIQQHRGPDDQGRLMFFTSEGRLVGLGSRRLAILDLSPAGHMPMTTPDGRYTIVYNGEIYNYPLLRRELEAKGRSFRSNSDTEAILLLYQDLGAEAVKRLNGIFAFAVWDRDKDELFLARDHFGVKPLYYCHQADRIGFASEIKALLELPGLPRALNYRALDQFLSFLWVPDPLTLFDGILKLPAGHCATFRKGMLDIRPYWNLQFPDDSAAFPSANEADLAAELRDRFVASVKSQMLSDVPLGSFLSAGIDSSAIVAAMTQDNPDRVRTYTISFPAKYRVGQVSLDDTTVARRTAAHFGCEHTDILVEPDVVDLLPKLIWHMDEPVADPAIITAYLVNREARKTVTVLLSGVGGDELFAGYRKHQAHELALRYQRIPGPLRKRILEPFVRSLPSLRGTRWSGHVRLAKKMAASGSLLPRERFLRDSVYLTEEQKNSLVLPEWRHQVANADPLVRHLAYFDDVAHADFLNQMLYVDTKAFMTSLNLTYNDKMSMASSVEVRVPFLDRDLVEWTAANVPPSLKLFNRTTKHIFREAMRPLLPSEVLEQKKAGFGAPADYWLAHDLREMTDDLLGEENIRRRGLFAAPAVRSLIAQHRSGRHDWSLQIWQFVTLELWMRTFFQ